MQINNQRTSPSIGLNGILYDIQLPRIGAIAVASGESTALVRRLANVHGYRSVIVMAETQSQEKKDMLRLCGADLRLVPAVPSSNPNHYASYSGRLADELAATEPNGAIWANQFDNVANREGHYRTTGPQIWEQTNGKVDGFVCSSTLLYQITDEEALPVLFDLIEHEGLVLGGSTGINIVGAMRLARELGPSNTIITILADGGQRYQSKLFNPDFLRKRNPPLPSWME